MSEIASRRRSHRSGAAPDVEGVGLQKHGRTFVRDTGAAAQIFNVQASQWNQGAEGNFTLNLGVYFPAVAERRGQLAPGAYPRDVRQFAERQGIALPER